MKLTNVSFASIAKVVTATTLAAGTLFLFSRCGGDDSSSPTPPPTGTSTGQSSPTPTPFQSSGVTTLTGGLFMTHNDLYRTGSNNNEKDLNANNVNVSDFGKIGSLTTEGGQVYAQPLVANGVTMPDGTLKNIVYVVTENDTVYAYDVTDRNQIGNASRVWKRDFINGTISGDCSSGSTGTSTGSVGTSTGSTGTSDGSTGTSTGSTGSSGCGTVNAKAREATVKAMPMTQARAKAKAEARAKAAAAAGTTSTPIGDVQVNAPNISPVIGITATPVIDPVTQTIYITAMTDEAGTIFWRMHALSLVDGTERPGSPVTFTDPNGGYPGQGYSNATISESVNGKFQFSPITQLSRAGLVLDNNKVTIAFSSFNDNEPDHGWVFSYEAYNPADPNSLQLAGVWVSTPNSGDGNIWMGGGAPAVDGDHSIIFSTGNGAPETQYANANPPDFADSILRLKMSAIPNFANPNASYSLTNDASLPYNTPADYFTPYNHAFLATRDVDLGSGGVLLIPESDVVGENGEHLMLAGGKLGTIYVLNRGNMGKLTTSTTEDDNVYQALVGAVPGGKNYGPGIYGVPAYFNKKVYYATAGDYLRSFSFTDTKADPNVIHGKLDITSTVATQHQIMYRGASPSISAYGQQDPNAVVWYLDASAYTYGFTPGTQPPTVTNGSSVLYAYRASDMTPLYNSTPNVLASPGPIDANADRCATSVAAGCAVKFAVPTVQNGMVFVGTNSEVSVFGKLTGY